MARPTLKTLARHLDLSVTTVSRALKDGPEVRPDTIARVKAAASDLGYVPDLKGVKLRTGRTYTVYAMLAAPRADEVGDAGSVALMHGIHETLDGGPYSLTAIPLLPGMDDLAAVRRVVDGRLADGVILDLTRPQDLRVKVLLEHDLPLVTFGRTELFSPHPYFDIDNEHAAHQATSFLAGRGHRRIALIDPRLEYLFARQRRAGYRRALAEVGLEFDESLVSNRDLGAAESRRAVLVICGRDRPPTGFVCANEVSTLGVLAGLRDAGLRVGADVDVVSRDGTMLTDYLTPPISTCYYSLHEVGQRLATTLLRRIDGEPPDALQQVVQTTLIERG